MVSIKCESDDLTSPRNLEVTQAGLYSIAMSWEPPECGSVGEYHIELAGIDAKFDVHRQSVIHPSVSITGLLPGTEYQIRVRAADRSRTLGPWNDFLLVAKTEGEPLDESHEIEIDYRTDTEVRISWQPYEDERLQHYEVMATEVDDGESQMVIRGRVNPLASSHVFSGLQRNTQYEIGVVVFIDHEPKLVYKLLAKTASSSGVTWKDKPSIAAENAHQFSVQWKKPELPNVGNISKFVIEYRLPNETQWRKYDDLLVEEANNDYHILFDGIHASAFYSFRILAIDDQLKLAAKTAEITLGSAASESCASDAGIPQNVRASFISHDTIQFKWEKPQCDQSYGAISGYEYLFWNEETDVQPEKIFHAERNMIKLNELDSGTRYSFRVRSRAGHGHSSWSETVSTETEADIRSQGKFAIKTLFFSDNHNIYQLRIILAPPLSYLAWTPLPEHSDDIVKFKLSYKKSASDQWTRVIEKPQYFKCPDGIADAEDFCFDLSKLSFGVQYTADVTFTSTCVPKRLFGIEKPRIEQRGSRTLLYWTVGGDTSNVMAYQVFYSDRDWRPFSGYITHSPSEIHYRQELSNLETNKYYYVRVSAVDHSRNILATSEATSFAVYCRVPSIAPQDLRLQSIAEGVRLLWNWTGEDDHDCEPYFLITGYQNGVPFSERIIGRDSRQFTFQNAIPGEWHAEMRAGNRAGTGPSSSPVNLQNAFHGLVSKPRVSARDGYLSVEWVSQGIGQGVFGYRVQYRTDHTGWTPYGQIVPYVGDNKLYMQQVTGLQQGSTYHLHIQVLDRNSYVMYTSPEVSARTVCSAPTHPPSHLQVQAADPHHIRASWMQPPQSTWQCNDIQIEIEVTEPSGIQPVLLNGRQTTYVFDSEANQPWSIRIRSKNSAGASAWTQIASARTPPVAELIIGPVVSYRHGIPLLTWTSKEQIEDLVRAYQIDYRTSEDLPWQQYQVQVPFTGWQRPYSIDLNGLPSGHNYQIRVRAMDANNGIAYTSAVVNVKTEIKCSAPRRVPFDVQATSLGPTQVRVSWRTLHESEWNCNRLWYIVKYSTLHNQGFKNLTHGENYVIFDSEPFTQWTFEVQAANPSGETQWSRPVTVQTEGTAPGPVSDFRIYSQSSDTLQLSWRQPKNPNGRITGYEITYQLLSKGMCGQISEKPVTITTETPSFTLKSLSSHSKYLISVAAKTNIAGERISQEVQTEDAPPTGTPIHIRITNVLAKEVDLVWQAPECLQTNGEITEYEYELRLIDQYNKAAGTKAKITGLSAYTRYSVRMRAFTRKGPGPWSVPVQFQTAAAPDVIFYLLYFIFMKNKFIPAPPMVRVYSTGSDNADLIWQEPYPLTESIDKYKCKYAVAGTKQYQERFFPAYNPCAHEIIRMRQLPPPQSGTKFHCGKIDGLQPEKEYTFMVSAGDRSGTWSPWSEPQLGHISVSPVQVNSLKKLDGTANSILIGWNVRVTDVARVVGYRIHVTPVGQYDARPLTFSVDRSTSQYNIDNLLANTRYNITVDATTDGINYHPGIGIEASTDSAPLTGILTAPRVIEEQANSVTLEWNTPSGHLGSFVIEYRLGNGAWQHYSRRVAAHPGRRVYTAQVDQLPTNSVVDLRIRVVSPQNEQSAPSPEVRARTRCSAPPSPPQAIRVDAPSTSEVRVSWARPAKDTWQCDQLNYDISTRVSGQKERIVSIPGDQTEYTFPADANSRWTVKVRSSNQVGTSPWSSEQTITTKQGIPGPVRDLRLRAKSPNEVLVQWLAPLVQRGTIVGYDISYRLKHRLACPDEEPRDVSRDFVTVYNHKDLEYTLTGLLPFSLYQVRVRARTTELGLEEMKEIATEQQPPSAPPLNLQLSYALERSISFQWEPVECSQRHGHIVNYEYEIQGQDDWAKLERQIANTTDTKVNIEGLTPFTKYIMRVKAYNSIGGGPNTENLDAMTAKANAPLPPQDLVVAQEGTDYFMISWLPPYPPYGPHDKYKIQYQLLNDNRWTEIEKYTKDRLLRCPAESPRHCFNVTGLPSGSQFRVQVAAHIEDGSYGPWSTVTIANTLQILPDAPRAIELVEKTDSSLHIRWIPPSDPLGQITQYKVGIVSLDDPYDHQKTFLVDHPMLQHILTNLRPETSYNISISAGTKRGFGPIAWTRYSTDPFKVPAVLFPPQVTTNGSDALNVQWNGILDTKNQIHGYIIEFRSSDNPTFTEYDGIVEHDVNRRNYKQRLSLLDSDTLYFIRIKVVDRKQRVSSPSPEGSARTGCAPPLAPPSNVNAFAPSPHQVHINWEPPIQSSWQCSNIRYKVEYINGSSPHRQIDVPSGVTDWALDATPNTFWRLRVRVENEAGASEWSKEVSITTAEGAPSAVENLDGQAHGPEAATITWRQPLQPNGQISGYTLVYKLKSRGECGPRSAQPITLNTQNEEMTLQGLLPDSTYDVHVTAHTSQVGPQSNIITVTTEEAVPTGPPLNPRVSFVTQARGDFLWNEPDCELRNGKITGYQWQLESLDQWGENKTGHSDSQRVSFSDLIPYTKYRVRVSAENAVGSGPWSDWVSFRTQPSAPPSPTDLIEEESFPHAIEISFLPPSPPHGVLNEYRIRHTPSDQLNYKEVRIHESRLQCSDASKRDRLCYRVIDLEPEQEYGIQASAHTENGAWGEWSESIEARTHEQNIPVLERELEIVETRPNMITLRWRGLQEDQAKHIVGYVLEYKSEDEDWKEYNGVTKHRSHQNDYRVQVKGLEPSTEYFFRLKVVGKNDKRGSSGPEVRAMTNCGRPEEPPTDLKLSSDFENLKLTWTNPEEESWNCNNVEYVIDFVNTTSRGIMTVPSDAPSELSIPSLPGTKWDIRMRTQTIEEGRKPSYSPWSDRVTLVTQALPGELFLKVEPKTPTSAEVIWDLTDQDQKWNYGVDISYRLKQLGGCLGSRGNDHEPVTKYNVQDKQIVLENLKPGSEYEVIVTPRRPPSLRSSIKTPKTVRHFRTKADIPSGPPRHLRGEGRQDSEISFKWEPPVCEEQNGAITQYEYEVTGTDEWNDVTREGVTPRVNAVVDQLKPGSKYNVRVRAYTSEGAGPWSKVIQISTTGTELGPPRELTAVQTRPKDIQLTWLPPYPERAPVNAYKLSYSPRADESKPIEMEVSAEELTCKGYRSPLITSDNLCTTVKSLQPDTTYRFAVQGQSASGVWGEWSPSYFATTSFTEDEAIPGKLRLVSAGHDNLRVNWTAPPTVRNSVDRYLVNISSVSAFGEHPRQFLVHSGQNDFHFRNLESASHYNITVQGLSQGKRIWHISEVFSTTDYGTGLLSWLPPPTDLKLLEKSDRMMHVAWSPPEIFDPAYKDLITHYRVTIAPFDSFSGTTGRTRNYSVSYPGTSIKFEDLRPETIYNITVQAGTTSGYGEILWGSYSTLASGQNHLLRLVDRTPTSLTVEWEPTFFSGENYILSWKTLHSVSPHVRTNVVRSAQVDDGITRYTIEDLDPSTVYNVSLQPRSGGEIISGAYATLPPGWFMVRNLVWCDKTNYALSLTWEPVELHKASHYQVRYLRLKEHDAIWTEENEVRAVELLCPKDGCNRHCYLVFNMEYNPNEYVFQVRAKVNHSVLEKSERKKACCIVPPPYMVTNIGAAGTYWEVDIAPVESQRYYVVVDEREPAGSTNWTELTDKVTANKLKIPYYVGASFNADTLPGPRKVRIGDGTVIGGYLNYPLVKGKKYNYEIYSVWELNGKPAAVARQRASPYAISGWPWWWLLLLLLLLLLLILLTCCLLWYIRSSLDQKATARGDFEDGYVRGFRDANKLGTASAARRRMDDDYATRDDRFHEGYVKGLRDAGMTGMSTSMHNLAQRGQGAGYSSGYMQGFRDGNSGIFGDRITGSLLRRLEEQYPNQEEFRTGYIDGFKEGAGSRSSERKSRHKSKSAGDEIHTTKIYHVYNQQPDSLVVSGYSTTGRQLEQELEELTSSSRRSTLRRHYTFYLISWLAIFGLFTEQAERARLYSGTGTSYISRASAAERPITDTYSRRYAYRSRSDMGGSPRRYASHTILDGARPGPSTPHARRNALHTLQRELDTLSRSPDRLTPRGYSSDTGYMNDTMRSRTRAYSNYDYDTYQTSKNGVNTSAGANARYLGSVPARATTSTSYHRRGYLSSINSSSKLNK
ncbi:unnamed protein product [Thelazia callipaeda]|uniref:Fibronectin type-III domain-containing protein n=1 Tax=Thelazia callipaeda TaxID=103827 RepID=A0A158RBZ2_THECL|nr:unnamed protein product [Thelazia callipaeda]